MKMLGPLTGLLILSLLGCIQRSVFAEDAVFLESEVPSSAGGAVFGLRKNEYGMAALFIGMASTQFIGSNIRKEDQHWCMQAQTEEACKEIADPNDYRRNCSWCALKPALQPRFGIGSCGHVANSGGYLCTLYQNTVLANIPVDIHVPVAWDMSACAMHSGSKESCESARWDTYNASNPCIWYQGDLYSQWAGLGHNWCLEASVMVPLGIVLAQGP